MHLPCSGSKRKLTASINKTIPPRTKKGSLKPPACPVRTRIVTCDFDEIQNETFVFCKARAQSGLAADWHEVVPSTTLVESLQGEGGRCGWAGSYERGQFYHVLLGNTDFPGPDS